jgi:hypothetical protein
MKELKKVDNTPPHRITEIFYKKLVSNPYNCSNIEIGAKCEVEPGENPKDVYAWLKAWVLATIKTEEYIEEMVKEKSREAYIEENLNEGRE